MIMSRVDDLGKGQEDDDEIFIEIPPNIKNFLRFQIVYFRGTCFRL